MRTFTNSKKGLGVMIILVAICLVPAMAGAFGQGGEKRSNGIDGREQQRSPLGIWRNPRIVEKLALTDAQVKQVRDLDFAHREKQQALKAQFGSLRLELEKAMSEDIVDKAAVHKAAEDVADAKGSLFVQKIDARLALEAILTPAQVDKLQRYRMNQHRNGDRQGQGRMKGRHGDQKEDCGRLAYRSVE